MRTFKKIFLPALIWPVCFMVQPASVVAQNPGFLKGRVVNAALQPVSRATVALRDSASGAPWAFSISNDSGYFALKLKPGKSGKRWVSAEHLSYAPAQELIVLPEAAAETLVMTLRPRVKALQEIVVRAEAPKYQQRGDTTDFRASAYRTEETTKVEDMLRQLPGMQVGADGRLSFNGKEVEAVMVEGENLTEQNYQMLTRNLNAATVDRIQVLQHFQENRLMRDVSVSDKVGINLTIDPAFKGRLSGSADLALGTEDRRQADLNLIYLRKKIKWIQFLQHNNIGLAPNGGMDYHFDTEGGGKRETQQARDNSLLRAGTLYPPNLSDAYVRQNKDYSGYSIMSWKMGNAVQMKLLLSAADSRLTLQSDGEQTAFQPDGFSWQNFFRDQAFQRHKQYDLRYNLRHDAGKRNLGSLWIDLQQSNPHQGYVNQTSGAVTDSLGEQMQGRMLNFFLRAEESLKLRGGKLLQFNLRAGSQRTNQQLDILTGRFGEYFQLDTLINMYRQEVKPQTSSLVADITLMGRKQKMEYSYGLKTGHLLHDVMAETWLGDPGMKGDSLLSDGNAMLRQSYARIFGQLSLQAGKKSQWMLGGYGGFNRTEWSANESAAKTGLVYLISGSYTHSISPLSALSLQAQLQRDAPAYSSYYPDSVLTGQVTVLNGAQLLPFPRSFGAQVSYASNALHKGRVLFFSASWLRSNQQFMLAVDRFPAYHVQRFTPQDGNRNFTVLGKWEQHVKALQSKFSLQASVNGMRFQNVYNDVSSEVDMQNLRLQPEWVSTFKGPLNAEFSYTVMHNRNKVLPEDGLESAFSQWQQQGYAKLKARVRKKAYLAVQWARYRLSPTDHFNTLDLFAKWNAGKKFGLSLSGHNLLNGATIRQRQISPNMEWTQGFGLVGRYVLLKAGLQF
jgi:hypothetical protein